MKPQKLTWTKVDQIRAMYRPGEVGFGTLAKRFDVSIQTIKSIIRCDTWPPGKDCGAGHEHNHCQCVGRPLKPSKAAGSQWPCCFSYNPFPSMGNP